MSLFIGALAFSDPHLIAETRVGVFAGSIVAAFAGLGLLAVVLRRDVTSVEEERKAVEPFLVEEEKD